METHGWIVSVMADIEKYAAMNGLSKLQNEISRTKEIAISETGVAFPSEESQLRLNSPT